MNEKDIRFDVSRTLVRGASNYRFKSRRPKVLSLRPLENVRFGLFDAFLTFLGGYACPRLRIKDVILH